LLLVAVVAVVLQGSAGGRYRFDGYAALDLLSLSTTTTSAAASRNGTAAEAAAAAQEVVAGDKKDDDDDDDGNAVVTIGHAVSFITCEKQSRVDGFRDALVVLRHSVHRNSVHDINDDDNNNSDNDGSSRRRSSRYGYKMYAFIHREGCARTHPGLADFVRRLGYEPRVVGTPVEVGEIRGEYLRAHVEQENCCGSKEFIKLYAYTLTEHPLVVHWDLDVVVLKPMDDLFDAMLLPEGAPRQQRKDLLERLHLQRPSVQIPNVLSRRQIDAAFTRDVTSAAPWERVQAVQGGFVVVKPNREHFERFCQFILDGDYVGNPRRGNGSGWGVSELV